MFSHSQRDFCLWLDESTRSCVLCSHASGYETPLKLLNCFHSCCTKCLESKQGVLKCPVCNEATDLSVGENLPDNLVQKSLLQILSAVGHKTCQKCKKKPTAYVCFNCQGATLCEDCHRIHDKELRTHEATSLTDIFQFNPQGDIVEKLRMVHPPVLCHEHSKSKSVLDTYCTDCREVICAKCAKSSHAGHVTQPIEEISSDCRTNIIATLLRTGKFILQLIQVARERDRELAAIQNEDAALEIQIKQRMTKLKNMVDEIGNNLINKAQTRTKKDIMRRSELNDDLKKLRVRVEDSQAYAEVFSKITSDIDTVRHNEALAQHLDKLCKSVDERVAAKTSRRPPLFINFPKDEEVKRYLMRGMGELRGVDGVLQRTASAKSTDVDPDDPVDIPPQEAPSYFEPSVGHLVKAVAKLKAKEQKQISTYDEHGDYGRHLFNESHEVYVAVNSLEEICVLKPEEIAIYTPMGKLRTTLFCRFNMPVQIRTLGTDMFILDKCARRIFRFTRQKVLSRIYRLPDILSSKGTQSMAVSGTGDIYLASYEDNAIYFCEKGDGVLRLFLNEEDEIQLAQGIHDICLTPSGGMIVAICGGLLAFNKDKELLYLCLPIESPLMHTSICCDAMGHIYYTCGRGLDVMEASGELICNLVSDDNIRGDIYQIALSPNGNTLSILSREEDSFSKDVDYYYRLHLIRMKTAGGRCF